MKTKKVTTTGVQLTGEVVVTASLIDIIKKIPMENFDNDFIEAMKKHKLNIVKNG